MSYVDKFGMLRGKSNNGIGAPCGKENLVAGTGGNEPLPNIPAEELGASHTIVGITRTNDIATVNDTGHGYSAGDIVRVLGADQYQYNGDKRVDSITDANNWTCLAYGSPTTPATTASAITCKKRQTPGYSDHV